MFLEDQLLWVDERDVLLAFTFRRYSVAAAKALRVFRERGAKVVLITDSASAPAALLGRPGAGGAVLQRLAVRFYTAPMALCNALLAAVAQRCRQPLGEALARGEALWDAQWIRS